MVQQKKRLLIGLLTLATLLLAVWWMNSHSAADSTAESTPATTVAEMIEQSDDPATAAAHAVPDSTDPTADATAGKPGTSNAAKASAEVDLHKRFQWALQQMGECLGVQPVMDDNVQPSLSDLESALQSEWGAIAVKSDDWTSSEIEMPDGSRRQLKLETDYDFGTPPLKRLKVFSKRDSGDPIQIEIPKDHADEPTDGIMDSYKAEGKVVSEDLGGRAYFKDGQEISYVTKNGRFSELEVSKNDKIFRCNQLLESEPNCTCAE